MPVEASRWPRLHTVVLPLLTLGWLLTLIRSTLTNGDAAVYLTQIQTGDWTQRTVHLGYFLLAWPWVNALSWLEPILRLNTLSVVCGVVGVLALRGLETRLFSGVAPGWSGLWWLASASVLGWSSTGEIYAAQWTFLLLASLCWSSKRAGIAGIFWAVAIAISPTSLASWPLFLLFRRSRSDWFRLSIGPLVVACLLLGLFWEDYLFGPRGLWVTNPGLTLMGALNRRLAELPAAIGWMGIPMAVALLKSDGPHRIVIRRLFLCLLLHALSVWLLVDRFTDVPAHGLTLALASLLASVGMGAIGQHLTTRLSRSRATLFLCILWGLQAFTADQSVRHQRRQEAAFAAYFPLIAREVHAGSVPLGSFSDRMRFEYFLLGRAPAGLCIDDVAVESLQGRSVILLSGPPKAYFSGNAGVFRDQEGLWRLIWH